MLPRSRLARAALLLASSVPLPAQQAAEAAAAKAPSPVKLVALKGGYQDLAEASFDLASALLGGGGAAPKSFYGLIEQLDTLAKDAETSRLLLDLTQPVGFNLVQMSELERALGRLRAAGKTCYAYLEGADRVQYQIASQCDKILMADMGVLDLGSLAMSTTFFKDAFDLLGIQYDIVRCGDFKGAVEPYMLPQMSPHLRRHYLEMLEPMNADIVRRIAKGRGLAAEKVRALQGERVIPARRALVEGLVDRLVPWQGARRALEGQLGDEKPEIVDAFKAKRKRAFNPMTFLTELLNPKDEEQDQDEELPLVTVLHLSGGIVDGAQAMPGSIVSGPAVEAIRALAGDDEVKGVVVRINSPGGSATASEAVVLALKELAAKKPVVCSLGRVAASGGYYITCFGRPILAEPGTITGSIGVFGMKPNVGTLMRRVGVHQELIALDEGASFDAIDRGWSEAQKAQLQAFVDDVYDRFLHHVAASRKLQRSEVEAMAGGRVWSGDQAVARKLVDKIGGLDDAIAMVVKEAGLEKWRVQHTPRPRNLMQAITEQLLDARLLARDPWTRAVLAELGGIETAATVLLDALRHDGAPRVWALMPVELRLR